MAEDYHKPGPKVREAVSGQERQLIVKQGYYDYQGKQKQNQRAHIAEILLKGKWLAQAGFEAGQQVTVKVLDGCLVLTKKEE